MDSKTKRKCNQTRLTKKRVRKTYQQESDHETEEYEYESKENILENPSSGKAQLCRVCLNEGDIPIYGDESIGDISEPLTIYGGIEIDIDDELPKYLCHDCHEQLQNAIKFKQTAQETDQILRDGILVAEENIEIHLEEETYSEEEEEVFKETLADINTIYNCRDCEIDFDTPHQYGTHMFLESHKKLKDKCPFCHREYPCIQKHLSLHKLHDTILCKTCGEKFLRPNFWRHRESHHDILPYKCPKCPYRGRYGSDFKIHMRKHTGERPYQCSECPAGFISKSNLNRHMLTHKNDFKFQCDECAKGCYSKQELELHVKVSHIGLKEHLCNLCGKAYGSRKALMKHQFQVHKREKMRGGKIPVYMRLQTDNDREMDDDMITDFLQI